MEAFTPIIQGLGWEHLLVSALRILVILVLAWLTMLALHKLTRGIEQRMLKQSEQLGEPPSDAEKRSKTLMRIVRQSAQFIIWITVILIIFVELGINIGPILASAGIIGVIIGFGAQNLVRDFLSGFFFIFENQIRVGDVAIINGTGGLVEKVNLRTIVLRDLAGVVHVFPNGSVTTLSNLTKEWSAYVFEIGVAYKEDIDRVVSLMKEVSAELKQDAHFGPYILDDAEVFGLDKFGDSALIIKGRIKTLPTRQWEVGREYLRRIKHAFDKAGIEIPFPHRTLYFAEQEKPLQVALMEKHFRKP